MKWLTLVMAMGLMVGLVGCNNGPTEKVKGPGGKELKVTAPGTTDIKQGDSKDVKVSIARSKFDEPVTVTLADLPKGVTADKNTKTIDKGQTSVNFTLTAAADAPPEEGHKAKVSAEGGGMKEGPMDFTVDVKKK